jgi:hypothetical protein
MAGLSRAIEQRADAGFPLIEPRIDSGVTLPFSSVTRIAWLSGLSAIVPEHNPLEAIASSEEFRAVMLEQPVKKSCCRQVISSGL